MRCHRCGNTLPTQAVSCPYCYHAPDQTRRFSQEDAHKTRLLIQVERCANCGFLTYPSDVECQSCGTWIDRPWQTSSTTSSKNKKSTPIAVNRTLVGLVAGVMTGICVLVALFIFLNR